MSSKANILIVEDSFIVAYHLQITLESEGYTVAGTQDSGEGALSFLESHKPDLVLMDIMLNGPMDGIETARVIRMKYNLPIIYITALTDKDTIQRAKITEPFGYLTKPFEDREIFTVIEMALYKHDIEFRLRQSEEKYFSTVRSISDAVIVIDRHYCVTYINPSAEGMSGWVLKEAHGRSVFEIMRLRNSETNEYPVNPLQCRLGSARINSIPEDLVLLSKQEKPKPIGEGSMSPMIDSKGNFIGLVLVFKDIAQKIENEKLIKNFEKERLAALLEGQEKERSRIARDLHDGLGQMLTAVKMNVNLLMKENGAAKDLLRLIDDAIQESVRISENLLPSKLRDFDLPTCIKSLCTQIAKSTDSQILFESFGVPLHINHNQKVNFYRIAQEAINNAIKHADALSITVQLNGDEDTIRLTVEDDGKGIASDHNGASSRHGLVNMKDRAEIMGGKLIIESDADRGTLVIVEAPCDNKILSHV